MRYDFDGYEFEIDSERLSEFWETYTKDQLIDILIEHNIDDHFEAEIKEHFQDEVNEAQEEAELEERELKYLKNKGRV